MKPLSTVQLVAHCKPVHPLPDNATDNEKRKRLRLIIHNSSGLISWADFFLKTRSNNGVERTHTDLAMADVKREGLDADRRARQLLRKRSLSSVKSYKDIQVKYDTLTLSARYAVLQVDPGLEPRLSAAL